MKTKKGVAKKDGVKLDWFPYNGIVSRRVSEKKLTLVQECIWLRILRSANYTDAIRRGFFGVSVSDVAERVDARRGTVDAALRVFAKLKMISFRDKTYRVEDYNEWVAPFSENESRVVAATPATANTAAVPEPSVLAPVFAAPSVSEPPAAAVAASASIFVEIDAAFMGSTGRHLDQKDEYAINYMIETGAPQDVIIAAVHKLRGRKEFKIAGMAYAKPVVAEELARLAAYRAAREEPEPQLHPAAAKARADLRADYRRQMAETGVYDASLQDDAATRAYTARIASGKNGGVSA